MNAGMRLLAVALLVLGLAAMSGPSSAAPVVEEQVLAQAEGVQPLGRVLRQIEQRYPGRALDAELIGQAEPPVYRIKWLGEDGKLREVRVDARTGRILEVR
jgi:uncharacterized membrane protein YkoI